MTDKYTHHIFPSKQVNICVMDDNDGKLILGHIPEFPHSFTLSTMLKMYFLYLQH